MLSAVLIAMCLSRSSAPLLALLFSEGLEKPPLLLIDLARQPHVELHVLVTLAAGVVNVRDAVAAHAQPIPRLRARPHCNLFLAIQCRHPVTTTIDF